MSALTDNRDTPKKQTNLFGAKPVKGTTTVYAGSLAVLNAGYMAPGSTATGLITLGRAKKKVDNSAGTDGVDVNGSPIYGEFEPGIFRWGNGDSIVQADVGKIAWVVDDQTVSKASTGKSPAGVITEVDSSGVWVASSEEISRSLIAIANLASTSTGLGASLVGIEDAGAYFTGTTVEAALAETETRARLSAVTNGKGASLVGIEDAGAFTSTTTVEAALAEIYQHLKSAHVVLPINLGGAILAAGTPMAAFADSASSAPGVTLDNSKAVGVRWNDAATQVAVWMAVDLPLDLDPTAAATLVILAAKSGATVGDATTFTVTAFAQTVGALEDAGSDLGGTTGAMTGNATAKTVQRVTLSIATPPTPPGRLSLSIKPTNGTLGTDDVTVVGCWIEFKRKLLTS
jgi:hypothetical protein